MSYLEKTKEFVDVYVPEKYGKIAKSEINKFEEENSVLLELVDAAEDIIELYDAKTPAQKKWKTEWLKKARNIIALLGENE